MMPASTKAGGMCLAMPDTCKVPAPPAPPIPTPFPNQAQLADALAPTCSMKVKFENQAVVLEMTQIPQSSGDEAGTAGGLVSGMNMGPVQFKMGSKKVMVEGKGVAILTSMTAHNGSNANMPAGNQIAPSQAKVLVSP